MAAAVAAFTIGRVFGLMELFVLGAGLVVAIIVAMVVVRQPMPQVVVQRVVRPSMVAVGEPARVDIQVVNVDRRKTPHVQLWEPVGQNGGAPMQLAALLPNESASAAYRVPTSRRGLLTVGPLTAHRRDVLGLCSKATTIAGSDDVLIVPQHVHLPFPAAGSAGRLGQHLRMKAWGQTGGEFHSQREYQPGDDLRRVNWKASARSEELVVRETALEGVRRCTVVLDCHHGQYDHDAFERAVCATASVTLSSTAAGVPCRLVSNDVDLRGPEVGNAGLRWLAMVRPNDQPLDYTTFGRGVADGLGLVVLVTGSSTSPAAGSVRAGLSPDETMVVVSIRDADGLGRLSVDGTSLDALAESWSALVVGSSASGFGGRGIA
ncbi:MAG: DUF58 domain-containing protein [Ilumatobacteraceae bacterium]